MDTAYHIPDHLQSFVEELVAAGQYPSGDAVVSAAVVLLREREQRVAALRQELQPALDELARGEGAPLDIEDIKARGRARMQTPVN